MSTTLDVPTFWYLAIGLLFIGMVFAGSVLKRLPLSASLLYLGFGIGMGAWHMISIDPLHESHLLERLSELAVVISLFTAGLKLRLPFRADVWTIALRLASVSMLVSIVGLTLAARFLLHLPWGVSLLLAAILAPTDPVLASDVQVERPGDKDRLRFALTGEAGLNDGTAFPFVMLGLLATTETVAPADFMRWLLVDLIWSSAVGLLVGYGLGRWVGKFVLYLRRQHREAVGLDDFLALGLMALAYGSALWLHAFGFLAVFAAGLALRHIEQDEAGDAVIDPLELQGTAEELATDATKAPAFMTRAVLSFNEQLERIGEVTLVILLGAMLGPGLLQVRYLLFTVLLFTVIRPLSVWIGLRGLRELKRMHLSLIAWFGIRGLGSIYYLSLALQSSITESFKLELLQTTLFVVTSSVFVHGISVTPLMNAYRRRT